MCVGCVDCLTMSHRGEPCTAICDGFRDSNSKKYVIKNGHFTKHYRWCSNWTIERIKEEEQRQIAKQQN